MHYTHKVYLVTRLYQWDNIHLRVNLGMWPLKLIVLEKQALFWGFNTHLWGFQGDRWEKFIFRVNLGMWPLKLIVLEKWALFWEFQHTFLGFPTS